MSRKVMSAILAHREVAPLLSADPFSVDGTLAKARASMKGFRPKTEGTQGDDDAGGQPALDTSADDPLTTPETDPMPRTNPARAMPNAPSGARSVRMRPMPRRRIRMRGLHDVRHRGSTVLYRSCFDGKPQGVLSPRRI